MGARAGAVTSRGVRRTATDTDSINHTSSLPPFITELFEPIVLFPFYHNHGCRHYVQQPAR